MDKVWLESYPEGVPAEIDLEGIPSLVSLLEWACHRYADKVAFLSMGKAMTYRQLDEDSKAFAGWLQAKGLQKGDRVALMMPNVLQYPVALFGVLRAGCVVVNCNPLYTPRELQRQLDDAGATAIVIVENFAYTLEKAVADLPGLKHVIVSSMGDMLGAVRGTLVNFLVRRVRKLVPPWSLPGAVCFNRALMEGRRHGWTPVASGPEDIAFLQYTGGTTGVAKGAMLSHRNVAANVMQACRWIKPVIREGEELVLTALPLNHIFALTGNCLTFLMIGARNLLIVNPRDFPRFIAEWRKYPVSVVTGVNTLFKALLNDPGFMKLDFSSLKITLGGGMAVQVPVAERWQKVTGVPMLQAYGLTEASPAVTVSPLDVDRFDGAIGLPISSTDVSIRDDAGHELPLGEVGEICVRGPQVMKGYWRRPEETRNAFHPDGFLRTGDLGYLNERGFVFLVDRKKDMILVSGFNVYPNEVEEVIAMLPDVIDVAAIGVADEHSGEAVKVFVSRKNAALSEAVLIEHCRSLLTGYKVPKHVEFRDDLPRSNVGKIMRRALKE